jgi:hypothetical protein
MKRSAALLLGALVALAACAPRPAPRPNDPTGAALALFDAARREPLSEAEIAGIVALEEAPAGRARLLDAVASLASASDPVVTATTPAQDGARAAVDVVASLPGGGRGSFTVEVARAPDGAWRVTAFWGPGVGWPPRPAPAGEGLSVSPAPR